MKKGFSILEILVVLAIVGALAATLIPLMFRNKPTENWTHVLTEFNNVASLAVQASIEQNKVCRLTVEKNSDGGGTFSASIQKVGFPSGEDRLRKGVGAKTHKPVYEALSGTFIKDVFTLSKNISIADVWTPNKESEDGSPGKSCFIMPRGLTQKLIIHL